MSCCRLQPACLYVLHDFHPYYTSHLPLVRGRGNTCRTCRHASEREAPGCWLWAIDR